MLEVIQTAHDLGPLGLKTLLCQADFEFALQAKSQEAAEEVAADGFVALVGRWDGFPEYTLPCGKLSSTIQSIL